MKNDKKTGVGKMKGSKRKWKMLCAGLAAAGVLVAGVPGEQMPVAEAMYSSVDATHHWYKTPNEQQNLLQRYFFLRLLGYIPLFYAING